MKWTKNKENKEKTKRQIQQLSCSSHLNKWKFLTTRQLQQIASNHSSDIDFKDFMKLYKDYSKKSYLFLVNDTILSSDNPLPFTKNSL